MKFRPTLFASASTESPSSEALPARLDTLDDELTELRCERDRASEQLIKTQKELNDLRNRSMRGLLRMRAEVNQQTALDWKGVQLTLSTARSSASGTGALVDAESGELRWEIDLAQNASCKRRFSYTVSHPRDFRVDKLGGAGRFGVV